MRKLLYSVLSASIFLSLMSFSSCGKLRGVEEGEETQAEIEAAMMEGRSAAREFINKKWSDTMQLQSLLLDARTRRVPYDTVNKPRCREAFDSAFVSTVRTVRPDIAKALEKHE